METNGLWETVESVLYITDILNSGVLVNRVILLLFLLTTNDDMAYRRP